MLNHNYRDLSKIMNSFTFFMFKLLTIIYLKTINEKTHWSGSWAKAFYGAKAFKS